MSDSFIERYSNEGYTTLPLTLSTERVTEICGALMPFQQQESTNAYGILRHNVYQEIPLLRQTIDDYNIGGLAAALLEVDEVTLFQDNLIWKPTGTSQSIAWHQDYSYWPLSHPRGVTFWIALDDTTIDNGCMRYVCGSHHWGECQPANFIPHQHTRHLHHLPPLTVDTNTHRCHEVILQAGQTVAHHPLLVHMSHPNLSQRHRRGWSLTWIDSSVRWDPEHAPHPYPVFHPVKKGDTVEGNDFPRYKR